MINSCTGPQGSSGPSSYKPSGNASRVTAPIRQSNPRPKRQFDDLHAPLSYIFKGLIKAGKLRPMEGYQPPTPPPKWWDLSRYCEYHQCSGHDTDHCKKLKLEIQNLIDSGVIARPNPQLNPNVHMISSKEESPLNPLSLISELDDRSKPLPLLIQTAAPVRESAIKECMILPWESILGRAVQATGEFDIKHLTQNPLVKDKGLVPTTKNDEEDKMYTGLGLGMNQQDMPEPPMDPLVCTPLFRLGYKSTFGGKEGVHSIALEKSEARREGSRVNH